MNKIAFEVGKGKIQLFEFFFSCSFKTPPHPTVQVYGARCWRGWTGRTTGLSRPGGQGLPRGHALRDQADGGGHRQGHLHPGQVPAGPLPRLHRQPSGAECGRAAAAGGGRAGAGPAAAAGSAAAPGPSRMAPRRSAHLLQTAGQAVLLQTAGEGGKDSQRQRLQYGYNQ